MVANDTKNGADALNFESGFIQVVNGKSAPTKQRRRGENPANREPKEEVPVATQEDVDRAVSAAKDAFKSWSKTPYEDRKRAVLAYADAIESVRDDFRDLLISEQGKPVSFCFFTPTHNRFVDKTDRFPKQTPRWMLRLRGYEAWQVLTYLRKSSRTTKTERLLHVTLPLEWLLQLFRGIFPSSWPPRNSHQRCSLEMSSF